MALKTKNQGKVTESYRAIQAGAGDLQAIHREIAAIDEQEAALKGRMSKSTNPEEVARLYDELLQLEDRTRRNKFLLPAQARAKAQGLSEQIAAALEDIRQYTQLQCDSYSQRVDEIDVRRAELDAEEQALRAQWQSLDIDKGQVVDLQRELKSAGSDRLQKFLNEHEGQLNNLVTRIQEGE